MSTTRIFGLSGSGIDVDQLVKDMMSVQRAKMDKMKQEKQIWEWKQEDYRSINMQLLSLRDIVSNLRLQGTFLTKKISASNPDVATITANAGATESTYSITVTKLATAAYNSSSAGISGLYGKIINGSISINAGVNDQIQVNYDGIQKEIQLDAGVYDIDQLVSQLQEKIDAAFGFSAPYSTGRIEVAKSADGRIQLISHPKANGAVPNIILRAGTSHDALSSIGFTDGASLKIDLNSTIGELKAANKFADNSFAENGSFTINGQVINYSSTDTLAQIIDRVNKATAANVTMFYDEATDKIVLNAKTTGSGNITVTGDFITKGLKIDGPGTSGTDAEFILNGLKTTRSSNTFVINGVSFNLKSTGTTDITVSRDTDAIYNAIKNFIDKYNEVIGKINDKYWEKRYKDYNPLTDEEMELLTEKQIEKWEEKARSGLLRSDPLLGSILSEMRSILMQSVTGLAAEKNTLAEIGIVTGTWDEFGKLKINVNQSGEDLLRKAIEEDPDAVLKLFTNLAADPSANEDEKGLAVRLYENINKAINRLGEKAGRTTDLVDDSEIGEKIRNLDKRMYDFEERLLMIEDRYYRQFAAMETALSKMNQQSVWLAQQLGSWQ